MLVDHKLLSFCQSFILTSVGPSKCPIDKVIGSQGHLTVGAVLWVQYEISNRLFQSYFFKITEFPNQTLKKVYCTLDKISLLLSNFLLIGGYQAFTNGSVGLQLDPQNVPLMKRSVCKAIWHSKQFSEYNMTSARGSLIFFKMNEFHNQAIEKKNSLRFR